MHNLKLKLASAAASVAAVAIMTAGSAQAAYEDSTIDFAISDSTPIEGSTFTVKASSNADCDWTAAFNGSTESASGENISAEFTAPSVEKDTDFALTVRCSYDEKPVLTATRTATVTVLAKDSVGGADTDESGVLPDTGGLDVEYLWAGGALILIGAGATFAARRRSVKA
ncbi:hypothetical protein [Aeromicrobium sp.]|uniref:hypothetical protein n=1 Tax=Aeromicrobium sp. TaxID=1871063 RepID=UPI0019C742EC|nr:hypothetical protein [Aeromicrobium sp.]MBC7630476.1 hypothetical protein [Aeromicrobium sp.]